MPQWGCPLETLRWVTVARLSGRKGAGEQKADPGGALRSICGQYLGTQRWRLRNIENVLNAHFKVFNCMLCEFHFIQQTITLRPAQERDRA